ncbi:MAG TPA: aldehyde dehydrogenase family protein, partial [Myxococcales bacterium]|nr:aldehyde dehydrogenase family protein [Myxococcales bacterium]
MELGLSEDQERLREGFARLFAVESSGERVRAAESRGFDPVLWELLSEMGALGLRVPESQGGSGASLHDAVIVAEQAGRRLATGPWREAIVAGALLAGHPSATASSWLARLLKGTSIVTFAPVPLEQIEPMLVAGGAVADAVIGFHASQLVLVERSGTRREDALDDLGASALATWNLGEGPRLVLAEGEAAKKAFKTWSKVPVIDRVQPLFKLKILLDQNAEEIATLIVKEHGKTFKEAMGDILRGIQMVEVATSMPTLMQGEALDNIARDIDCHSLRRPLGVFAGITPFNFPAMVPFWFWPFAIASGNTYVLKPSERVPLTQMKIFELIQQIGLPEGVLNMVHGGKDAVNGILEHPDIKGINFVGSTPIAKYVYQTGSANGKRVQALGGAKNFI